MTTTQYKRPGEIRIGTFDFKLFPEIVAGDALSSVSSVTVSPSGVTIGSPTISGTQVQALLSGGTDGSVYLLTATAITVAGRTLQAVGTLVVSGS